MQPIEKKEADVRGKQANVVVNHSADASGSASRTGRCRAPDLKAARVSAALGGRAAVRSRAGQGKARWCLQAAAAQCRMQEKEEEGSADWGTDP